MKKLLAVVNIVAVAFMVWVGASWVEVICKNTSENPTYAPTNFFVQLVEVGEAFYGEALN